MDDVVVRDGWKKKYTEGPTKAWDEMVSCGKIVQEGHSDFRPGYGMSWGRFADAEKLQDGGPP